MKIFDNFSYVFFLETNQYILIKALKLISNIKTKT